MLLQTEKEEGFLVVFVLSPCFVFLMEASIENAGMNSELCFWDSETVTGSANPGPRAFRDPGMPPESFPAFD